MKRLISLGLLAIGLMGLSACDLIQEEIERAESIELEDAAVLIHERSVLLKITSDADEQVIEDVVVNGEEYELNAQGDDWYLLEEVPVDTTYVIGDVYYRTGVGVRLSFNVDYEFELEEGLNRIPGDNLHTVDESLTVGEYTFSETPDDLVEIETEQAHDVEHFDDWIWVILEEGEPSFVVLQYDDELYVIEAPSAVSDYIED